MVSIIGVFRGKSIFGKITPFLFCRTHKSRFAPARQLRMSTALESESSAKVGSPSSSPAKEAGQQARDRCLFCRIVDEKKSESTRLIYKDDNVVVFPDIRPAAKYHLLVVPRAHIKDSKCLTGSQAHMDLLNQLVEVGNKVLSETIAAESKTSNGVNDQIEAAGASVAGTPKVLMGFHWPPFHTVSHLHLHVIAPSDTIGFVGRLMFRPNSYWFVSPEWVKTRLEKLKAEGK
jgi:diadenosine tetraphosphate (Ap4A) HIT family hydrolase